MWGLGWPIAVSMFCRFAMFSMDSACVGHLTARPLMAATAEGDDETAVMYPVPTVLTPYEMPNAYPTTMAIVATDFSSPRNSSEIYTSRQYLAASSLSDMVTNFLTTPLLAMSFGLNPLIAQSMGSGNLHMVGTWLKLALFCVTVATIPFLVPFFFVDNILSGFHFKEEVCFLAGVYARFNAIWVIPNSWYVTMRIYFQAQGKARPAMYFGLIFLFVNALFLWLLVFGGPGGTLFRVGGLGFIGAALSISASRVVQSFFYWLYMFLFKKEHLKTWPGFGFDFLQKKYVQPYFNQVLPQVATMLLQFLISQSTTLLVATLGVKQIDASTAATAATVPITICLLITFSSMTAIRVGMKLGQGHAQEACRTAWLCILCQAALTVLFGAVVLPLRKELMTFMTNDPEVQQLASELLIPIVLNFLFAGVVSSANGGILASQGRTSLSAKMVMFFELPFLLGTISIMVLVFRADVHVVYWVQALVTLIECFVILIIVEQSDWPKYAEQARARNQSHVAEPEPPAASAPSNSEIERNEQEANP